MLRRYFNRYGKTVALKPKADIVVVHPVGRFAQARIDEQWKDACFWTLRIATTERCANILLETRTIWLPSRTKLSWTSRSDS